MTTGYVTELTLSHLFDRILDYSRSDQYIHTDNDGDYIIETRGYTIFIYFEQSDSWGDWMSNFDFPISAYKNSEKTWYVHRGFLRVWKSMKDKIEAEVSKIVQSRIIKEIICVGYSHGCSVPRHAVPRFVLQSADGFPPA